VQLFANVEVLELGEHCVLNEERRDCGLSDAVQLLPKLWMLDVVMSGVSHNAIPPHAANFAILAAKQGGNRDLHLRLHSVGGCLPTVALLHDLVADWEEVKLVNPRPQTVEVFTAFNAVEYDFCGHL